VCKKLICLFPFVFVLSIFCSVQASLVSVDPSVEVVIGTDGVIQPQQSSYQTYNLQIRNFTNEHRVTLVSCDISGLRDMDQAFSNMNFGNLGEPAQSCHVTVGADNDIPGNYMAIGS
jgi:hypothetical protein